MKLIKPVLSLLMIMGVVGCGGNARQDTSSVLKTERTALYQCQQNKTLQVTYLFVENIPMQANIAKYGELYKDNAMQDFSSFTDGKYIWNLDVGLTPFNIAQLSGGMLTKKGEQSDEIIAKDCYLSATNSY